MKTTIYLTLVFLFQVSAAWGQTSVPDHEKLTAEVYELFQRSMKLHEEKDIDGLVNRFTPDGSLKMPGARRLSGHDDLRKHYAGEAGTGAPQAEEIDFKFAFISMDISQAGDIAVVMAEFDISSLEPGGFNDSGVILMVLKRIDGDWRIFAENVSSGPVVSFD